jgi:ornithine cyclodeaminase/alanine dehydrogenase-like protein (mu-crystallin family)
MGLLVLTGEELRAALPMRAAIDAMKDGFAALALGQVVAPPRLVLPIAAHEATTLLMGAQVEGMGLVTKTVSLFPRNTARGEPVVNGLVLVLDPQSGAPRALIDGAALTAWRTGAASGAATELLAREDASVGAVIGCGVQARTQLIAIDCVRQLTEVRVFARDPERVAIFCKTVQPEVSARLVGASSAGEAVHGADVVCAATTSHTPVFDGDRLSPGVHVNGVGSFTLDMCELDQTTITRSRVFIDELEAALAEAGELVAAERAGATARSDWTPLGLVAAGSAPGRQSPGELTLFKSVGHAVQDVAAGTRAVRAALEQGLGTELDL